MKFKSPYALGQRVVRASQLRYYQHKEKCSDMEVIEVCFTMEGDVSFLCEDIATGARQHYQQELICGSEIDSKGCHEFESSIGLREIVIRESHKNGEMVQERMMEVVGLIFTSDGAAHYICEDAQHGHRQVYSESMIVGDPDFDQEAGAYPISVEDSMDTNAVITA